MTELGSKRSSRLSHSKRFERLEFLERLELFPEEEAILFAYR